LPVIAIEESLHLRTGPLLLCHQCLQAHIGFTLAVSAHLRTVTDHLTPPTMRHKNGLINSRRDPQRSPNIPQVSKLRKKASTNDTRRGQRNTPSDPRLISALLLLSQRPEITRLMPKISEVLESEEMLSATTENHRTGTCKCRPKQLQPDFKLKVAASFADPPQH
jgi:hypothetical protein